ncbi:MAG: lipid II flippase MurJ, partial [Anaerolineales bacterium]
ALSWSSDSFDTAVTSSYAVGYLLLFLLLLLMVVRDEHLSGITLTLPGRQTAREIGEAIGYPLAGFASTQIARLTERSIASIVAVGGIASYYFAFRIVSGLQSLVGVSIAIVGLPTITRHELQGKRDRFARAMVRRGAYAVGMSLVLVAAILAFNHQIVDVLYGRGSFNQASVNVTASILGFFALGVPFSTLLPVLNAGLYARKQYAKVLVEMLVTAVADVGLAYWLSQILGLRGIALAFSLAALLGATVAIWLLRPVSLSRDRSG